MQHTPKPELNWAFVTVRLFETSNQSNRHRGDAGRALKHVNSPMVATTVNILKPRWLFGKIKGFMSSLLFGIPGISGNGSRCFRPFLHPSPQPSAMFEFMTPIPLQFLFWRGWFVLIWRARPRPRSLSIRPTRRPTRNASHSGYKIPGH